MDALTEELAEISQQGEIIICMDANAKIGLLGEQLSRNGTLIKKVFEECQMEVLNGSGLCQGQITHQNCKNLDEKSAIDLVATTYHATQWLKNMVIDEAGEF